MEKKEVLVDVLPLTPASDVKHIVRNVIPQPRPTSDNMAVVAFVVPSEVGTIVEHTVHEAVVLPQGRISSTIQQEVNALTGLLENTND